MVACCLFIFKYNKKFSLLFSQVNQNVVTQPFQTKLQQNITQTFPGEFEEWQAEIDAGFNSNGLYIFHQRVDTFFSPPS